jgi:hypothetical protein
MSQFTIVGFKNAFNGHTGFFYGAIIYGLHSKLLFLFCPSECVCPRQNMLAYYKIRHFSVNYGFLLFYSTGLGSIKQKNV